MRYCRICIILLPLRIEAYRFRLLIYAPLTRLTILLCSILAVTWFSAQQGRGETRKFSRNVSLVEILFYFFYFFLIFTKCTFFSFTIMMYAGSQMFLLLTCKNPIILRRIVFEYLTIENLCAMSATPS